MILDDIVASPGLKEYEQQFAQEHDLNKSFQTFVANLKITYEGHYQPENEEDNSICI